MDLLDLAPALRSWLSGLPGLTPGPARGKRRQNSCPRLRVETDLGEGVLPRLRPMGPRPLPRRAARAGALEPSPVAPDSESAPGEPRPGGRPGPRRKEKLIVGSWAEPRGLGAAGGIPTAPRPAPAGGAGRRGDPSSDPGLSVLCALHLPDPGQKGEAPYRRPSTLAPPLPRGSASPAAPRPEPRRRGAAEGASPRGSGGTRSFSRFSTESNAVRILLGESRQPECEAVLLGRVQVRERVQSGIDVP